MKKAMKQSTLVRILNVGSIVLLAGIALSCFANARYMGKLQRQMRNAMLSQIMHRPILKAHRI